MALLKDFDWGTILGLLSLSLIALGIGFSLY
jgi:hypothetical protein